MEFKSALNWKIFWLLFMAAELSMFAALPYSLSISGDKIYDFSISLPLVLAAQFAQGTVLIALSVFTGIFLGQKVGLKANLLESLFGGSGLPDGLERSLKISVLFGIFISLAMFILDRLIYSISSESFVSFISSPPLWQRFMYSFYVGMIEEMILRFFLLTLIVWITWKIKKNSQNLPTKFGVYSSIILVSIIYGIGNILSVSSSFQFDTMIYVGILIFNILSGSVFGWLYWKKGIEFAIVSNLVATFIIFVIFGSIV